MSMMKERWMEITFTGGKKIRFQYPVQFEDENVARYTEEALKLPTISICADGVLYVIPTNSIQLITVSPAPSKLPKMVIKGAKLIK